MIRSLSKLLTSVALLALLVGCSGDFARDPVSPSDANLVETDYDGTVWVTKHGPDGTYSFEVSESPETGSLIYTAFDLVVPTAVDKIVWATDVPGLTSTLTITELEQPGIQTDSLWVVVYEGGEWKGQTTYRGVNEISVQGSADRRIRVKFFNSVIETPGDGCTPGFWRQPQHFDSWIGYSPDGKYDEVFGVNYGGTLLAAVWSRGGGAEALARHAVAALLNSASPHVSYPYTTSQVIDAVQNAFGSGDYEETKNMLEGWNESGCPLD